MTYNEREAFADIEALFPGVPIYQTLGVEEKECITWSYWGPREIGFTHYPKGDRYMAPRHFYRYRIG